ncbi:hypothetical protein TIFTF001_024774 [Ficus carica]|uniref:DUF4219 domain-containing protein n=1 Tax=Ficus carica TaxID=3494 RepID=A0AA88AW48_FICCA|nr:hypothetical protein TIFTF001_024774 [Ficus carica]
MEEHGNSIVRELLHQYNYEEWSIQMETYLMAQGLWDVVKCSSKTPKRHKKGKLKVWTRKNAEALHVIQRSCGDKSFPLIKEFRSAKIAWATLADEYGSKADQNVKERESSGIVKKSISSEKNEKEDKDSDYAPGTDHNGDFQRHRPLFDAVMHGNWDTAKTYLDQHPDAVRVRIDSSGRTPLHIAVSAGHLRIVEELVQLMTEEDLLIQQNDDFTVLALSIQIGNIPIATCLIEKKKELVSVAHKLEGIPVLYAVCCNDFQMARFLYSKTPPEDLTLRDNGKMGASLICECIYRHNFDIPLDLLDDCPRLAITVSQYNRSPVWALSRCPQSIFPSGFRLGFWQRWLYDCIDVAGCTANQVIIEVQNQECAQRDKNDLTAIRSVWRIFINKLHFIRQSRFRFETEDGVGVWFWDEGRDSEPGGLGLGIEMVVEDRFEIRVGVGFQDGGRYSKPRLGPEFGRGSGFGKGIRTGSEFRTAVGI